jgi:hypothetical protein
MFHTKLLRPAILNDDKCFPNREATFFYNFGDNPEREWLVDSIVDHKFTNNSTYYGTQVKLLVNLSHIARTFQPLTIILNFMVSHDGVTCLATKRCLWPKGDRRDDYHHVIKQATEKPPPPDPQRSGKPVPKGKGRAKAPTPEIDDQAEQAWQGVTFSEDEAPAYEGKRKRKQWLAKEAEEWSKETANDRAKKEVWATARQADPSAEEINHFLSYRDDMNMDINAEVNSQSIKTSEASRPTSLWSASSEQFLHPPHNEGHSSGASSKASKQRRSPYPFGCSRESCTSSHGRGNLFEAGPPPGQYRQSSADEENRLLQEEVQHLRDYGCKDQMRIHFLERQLRYAEGLVQATQIQLRGPTTDHKYGQGRPPGRDYDDNHAHDLRRATEESRRT